MMCRRFGALIVAVGSVAISLQALADDELERLPGLWKPIEGIHDGQPLEEEDLSRIEILFSLLVKEDAPCGHITLAPPLIPISERVIRGRVVGSRKRLRCYVDAGTSPKRITIERQVGLNGNTYYDGIFKLDGDVLTVCLDLEPWNRRIRIRGSSSSDEVPTEFASRPSSGLTLLRLKNEGEAAAAYGGIRPTTARQVPALIEMLSGEDEEKRVLAIRALKWHGSLAKGAVPSLVEILEEDNPRLQGEAAAALGEIGAEARQATGALIDVLPGSEETTRRKVVVALGQIGPEAKAAAPALIRILAAGEPRAAAALARIAPESPAVLEALIAALDESSTRDASIEALAAMRSYAKPAISRLRGTMQRREQKGDLRWVAAVHALGVLDGWEARPALTRLIEIVREQRENAPGDARSQELLRAASAALKALAPVVAAKEGIE